MEVPVHFVKCCYESLPHTTGLYCVPLFDSTFNVCLLHISNSSIVFYPFVHGFHLRYITNYTDTNPQTKEQIGWDFKPGDKSLMTAIEFLLLAEGSVAPKSELLLKVSVQCTFAQIFGTTFYGFMVYLKCL